jgi:hypothetical protein
MTAAQLAALHRKRAEAVPREFRKTMNGVKISLLKYEKELMTTEIYGIPEDKRKNGKPKWRRTGHLRRSERGEVTDPYTVRLVNDAAYGLPRHEAGKPGHRKINPLRVSHWRDKAIELWESIKGDLLEATMRDILRPR